ncbi:MAG: hypothetical protein LBV51_05240 [Acholeplasmatales bacterium]|nr:hypothetical protein [Acholeplasmatales bacterium]
MDKKNRLDNLYEYFISYIEEAALKVTTNIEKEISETKKEIVLKIDSDLDNKYGILLNMESNKLNNNFINEKRLYTNSKLLEYNNLKIELNKTIYSLVVDKIKKYIVTEDYKNNLLNKINTIKEMSLINPVFTIDTKDKILEEILIENKFKYNKNANVVGGFGVTSIQSAIFIDEIYVNKLEKIKKVFSIDLGENNE